jgi:hypothetical protein
MCRVQVMIRVTGCDNIERRYREGFHQSLTSPLVGGIVCVTSGLTGEDV